MTCCERKLQLILCGHALRQRGGSLFIEENNWIYDDFRWIKVTKQKCHLDYKYTSNAFSIIKRKYKLSVKEEGWGGW